MNVGGLPALVALRLVQQVMTELGPGLVGILGEDGQGSVLGRQDYEAPGAVLGALLLVVLLQLRKVRGGQQRQTEAGGFVTTEKDAVNLGGYLVALAPLAVVPVKMELADAANAVDTMLRVIEEGRRRS